MFNLNFKSNHLVSILQKRASCSPKKVAYIFLEEGKNEKESITYAELDKKARAVAAHLQNKNLFGQRVLLLFPAGLEFIVAFMGCLYAGAIAVSTNVQKPEEIERAKELIDTVLEDAGVAAILTVQSYVIEIETYVAKSLSKKPFLMNISDFDLDTAVMYQLPKIFKDTIAFLQYTSGSTSQPKAAIISHQQLLFNLKATAKAWHYSASSVTLTWSPHSHIYGLACGLLVPLYSGSLGILMAPEAFIRRPVCWLEAITKYRVTHSGAPNFGYELCVTHVQEDELFDLNLASWVVAVNGGESVQYETFQKFNRKFSRFGFRLNHFCPAYGMSELAGAIAVSRYKKNPIWFDLSIEGLKNNQVLIAPHGTPYCRFMSSGRLLSGLQATIVDPETFLPVGKEKIGEIWLRGKSLSLGYWQNITATRQTFYATIPGFKKHYFRTGDLGFIKKGELCLTGRLKDLLVIHGKKYYPLDLEATVSEALKNFPVNQNRLVFSLPMEKGEEIIFVQEVEDASTAYDEIIKTIQLSILSRYGIDIHGVILVKANAIPKTASGKLQRELCKQQLLENKLDIIKQHIKGAEILAPIADEIQVSSTRDLNFDMHKSHQTEAIEKKSLDSPFLVLLAKYFYPDFIKLISLALNISEEKINLNSALSEYQVDSVSIIRLTALLNETYHLSITAASLFEYFTLAEFFDDLLAKNSDALSLYYHQIEDSHNNLPPSTQVEFPSQKTVPIVQDTPVKHQDNTNPHDIAVIGMSGVFPGAADLNEFWNNLISGKDVISEIPKNRWDWKDYCDDSLKEENKNCVKWGGFVEGIMEFDAEFFNIPPREAELIDPQQRLFLQTVWKAIEDAGYTPKNLAKIKTGIFVGVFSHDYAEILHRNNITDPYTTSSTAHSILANRVSYLLNLHGPSIAIDTACSSSLVAIHDAIRAIQNHDCDVAIVGGVNALLSRNTYLAASKAGMLSPQGQCKTFDKKADGYVRGEGVGAILLKPLSAALAEGDHVYGVIKGSAINHGGHVNSLTVPNPHAQADVIVTVCRKANIPVDSIAYIETHGTGTALGDPIEVNGLKQAFSILSQEQKRNLSDHYCGLTSVKTHIGHLESAAGIASVIKVLLSLKHQKIPGNLHFNELNPEIIIDNTPFYIVDKTQFFIHLKDEKGIDIPRRVGISSFGFGGTNAHILVEESPISEPLSFYPSIKLLHVIVLSAKTIVALQQRVSDLAEWLSTQEATKVSLSAISYTLSVGREHFGERCALIVNSIEELQETLNQIKQEQKPENFILNTVGNKSLNQVVFQQFFSQLTKALHALREGFDKAFSITEFRNKLMTLGHFYAEGYEIDWEELYLPLEKKRISLPTYPFAKNCYEVSLNLNSLPLEVEANAVDKIQERKEDNYVDAISLEILNSDKHTEKTIQENFKNIISRLLKIRSDAINVKATLSELGLDSITLKELAIELEDYYDINLNPSLFFIYQTIQALSHYLFSNYPERVKQVYSSSLPSEAIQQMTASRVVSDSPVSPVAQEISTLTNEPIAIIGMQGVFPQSKDIQEFWEHLQAGNDLITEIPSERWDWSAYYGDTKEDETKTNSKWGGFLNDVTGFDAAFFNLSSREANLMDPRHRLFMEIVWKAIEDAGYDPSLLPEETGLFVGVERNEYQNLLSRAGKILDRYATQGNAEALLANRISYFLNLHGPSEVINTACSSSLVAIHRAVSALRNGECSVAIAGGVNLILDPNTFIIVSQLGVLSPDGRCKTFDKNANGYVKGEGVCAVFLKPLEKAKRDGDHIYGVIKGSAVSHGGKAQSLTAPNAVAQSQLLMKAYAQANIDPETITYIETHGTGTELGDPVEIEGLKLAFAMMQNKPISKKMYCGLGSVKTNMGHLEPASGIASVMKVVLAMQHGMLPKNLHFNELNPYIDIIDSPFYIIDQLQSWEHLKDSHDNDIPYRAGISSFGLGGTIAHVLIEEQPKPKAVLIQPARPYYLVALSAKQEKSLKQKFVDLYHWLENHSHTTNLPSLSFTLNVGRTHFDTRCVLMVSSLEELKQSLQALINGEPLSDCRRNTDAARIDFSEAHQLLIETFKNEMHHLTPEIYREKLKLFADLYVHHHLFDWNILYGEEEKRRVASLPPYPFLKSRCWFDTELEIENNLNVQNSFMLPAVFFEKEGSEKEIESFTLRYLQQIFSHKVKLLPQQIAIDVTYEAYGIDSLLSMEIINSLEKDFGALSKTLLYEKNQLRYLASYLQENFTETLKTLYREAIHSTHADPAVFQDVVVESQSDSNKKPSVSGLPRASCARNDGKKEGNGLTMTDSRIASDSHELMPRDDIAIIGLSGIYPMAKNLDEFWQNLIEGRNCITKIPLERWNYKDYPVSVNGEEKYYKYGGFIDDIDKFDPLFFNISPRDAGLMDPQERLFLQSAWATFEDAGYTRERLRITANNEVGVFVGATYNFYPLLIAEEWHKGNKLPLDVQMFSIANRVSYFLNFSGPSYVVDTACSSSLSAIHLAYESLMNGECKMAIAGGVNLSLHPCKYHFLASYGFLSEEGQCASFAEGGAGYVPSEGVGAVLLKPLSLAIKDNDHIYGVIKGSSMNHGGKTSGYTVPNPNAQANIVKNALKQANINARTISYIEAHGTGTALGDPIEISGLRQAFEEHTKAKQFCAIGSVKSNIGHLEAAAGISQLTKVLLQMQHKKLVPSLHTEKLNPYIHFSETPFFVQQTLEDWQPSEGNLRRAGISSFGAGGTNVHLIVEEFVPEVKAAHLPNEPHVLFLLSANNVERLQAYVFNMRQFLLAEEKKYFSENEKKESLYRICYTLQIGRESMATRLAIVVASYHDLIEKLTFYINSPQQTINSVWFNPIAQSNAEIISSEKDLTDLMQQKAYEQLAEQWVKGAKIPWQQLYKNETISIVSLPTYPFAKRRCWVSEESNVPEPANVQGELQSETVPQFNDNQVVMVPTTIQLNPEEISASIINILAKSLQLSLSEIDPDTSFQSYGLDSMTGIHFISELSKCFVGKLSPMDLYRYPTVNRLAEYIIKTCQLVTPAVTTVEKPLPITDVFMPVDDNKLLAEILHLSDEEIHKLIEDEAMNMEIPL